MSDLEQVALRKILILPCFVIVIQDQSQIFHNEEMFQILNHNSEHYQVPFMVLGSFILFMGFLAFNGGCILKIVSVDEVRK